MCLLRSLFAIAVVNSCLMSMIAATPVLTQGTPPPTPRTRRPRSPGYVGPRSPAYVRPRSPGYPGKRPTGYEGPRSPRYVKRSLGYAGPGPPQNEPRTPRSPLIETTYPHDSLEKRPSEKTPSHSLEEVAPSKQSEQSANSARQQGRREPIKKSWQNINGVYITDNGLWRWSNEKNNWEPNGQHRYGQWINGQWENGQFESYNGLWRWNYVKMKWDQNIVWRNERLESKDGRRVFLRGHWQLIQDAPTHQPQVQYQAPPAYQAQPPAYHSIYPQPYQQTNVIYTYAKMTKTDRMLEFAYRNRWPIRLIMAASLGMIIF